MTVTHATRRQVAADGLAPAYIRRGHHGHRLDGALVQALVAELVGTLLLVVAITAAVVAATLAKPLAGRAYGSLAVPVAGGLALVAMAVLVGSVSGAHCNPAVTVAAALDRQLPWRRVPGYVVAQLAGAISAALLVWWWFGDRARDVAALGAPAPARGVTDWRAFGAEAVATFVLVAVVLVVASGRRPEFASTPALIVGVALAGAILVTGPVSGGSLNPARALGPMIVADSYHTTWVYLLAPIAAAAAAVGFVRAMLGPVPMSQKGA